MSNPFSRISGESRTRLIFGIYLSLFSLVGFIVLLLLASSLSQEIQEVVVFITGISFFYSASLFMGPIRGSALSVKDGIETDSSKQSVFVQEAGDSIQRGSKVDANDQSQSIIVPENYFGVLRSIEALPESIETDNPSGKSILVRLQAHVEADPTLSLEEQSKILAQIKDLADTLVSPAGSKQESVTRIIQDLQESVLSLPSLSSKVNSLLSSLDRLLLP